MLREKSERASLLRGLLNAGNRADAMATRCAEGGARIERFNVYCPKVLACIGEPPETIRDRAIAIAMQRRRPEEKISRFIYRQVRTEARVAMPLGWIWLRGCWQRHAVAYLTPFWCGPTPGRSRFQQTISICFGRPLAPPPLCVKAQHYLPDCRPLSLRDLQSRIVRHSVA